MIGGFSGAIVICQLLLSVFFFAIGATDKAIYSILSAILFQGAIK
jgi:hypothetical protein